MYLDSIATHNPGLITAAARLHAEDVLPANTYVVDLDAIKHNADVMAREAERVGIELYLMTKHFNRNPIVTHAALAAGIGSTVGVEAQDALYLHRFGLPVGHVGHLVQIPRGNLRSIVGMRPEVMTGRAQAVSATPRVILSVGLDGAGFACFSALRPSSRSRARRARRSGDGRFTRPRAPGG